MRGILGLIKERLWGYAAAKFRQLQDRTGLSGSAILLRIFTFVVLYAALIWTISYIFMSHNVPQSFNKELGICARECGSILRYRTEGWANTEYGDLDVIEVKNLKDNIQQKVLFLGNSNTNALGVSTEDKMSHRLTVIANVNNIDIIGISIARDGDHIANKYFDIIRYKNILKNNLLYVIAEADIINVMPNFNFLVYPEYKLIENEKRFCNNSSFTAFLFKFSLNSLYLKLSNAINSVGSGFSRIKERICSLADKGMLKIRVAIAGEQPNVASMREMRAIKKTDTPKKLDGDALQHAWDYLLSRLINAADGVPILFIYAPPLPTIGRNGIDINSVSVDKDSRTVAEFSKACKRNNIAFIDMRPTFVRLYLEDNKLPAGFNNHIIGRGHLNQNGHDLIARAVFQYIMENINVSVAK